VLSLPLPPLLLLLLLLLLQESLCQHETYVSCILSLIVL
jgi:hypothetical protein